MHPAFCLLSYFIFHPAFLSAMTIGTTMTPETRASGIPLAVTIPMIIRPTASTEIHFASAYGAPTSRKKDPRKSTVFVIAPPTAEIPARRCAFPGMYL